MSIAKKRSWEKNVWLWLAPNFLILIAIFIIPTFSIIRYSFTDATLTAKEFSYTLEPYIQLFTSKDFYNILWLTVLFVFFSVLFQTLTGLATALAMEAGEKRKMFGTVFVRVCMLLSWSIPGSIIGVIWKLLLDESPSGILQVGLTKLGLPMIPFLSNATIAFVCIIVANVWRGSAQSMILCYSGLKTVSTDILEAASVDGANAWQTLIHVTLPSIREVLYMNVILNVIATFNTFDMVMSLTGGGPGRSTEVLALSAYKEVFKMFNLNTGSAIAVSLLIINSLMAIGYFYLKSREER